MDEPVELVVELDVPAFVDELFEVVSVSVSDTLSASYSTK